MTNRPKFRLGIAMAGAVSAGAYTAGVIDYLLETLRDWQVEKDKNRAIMEVLFPEKEENGKLTESEVKKLEEKGYNFAIPMHDVIIEVFGGASAGAMTAAVTTLALCTEIKPVATRVEGDKPTGNLIYDAWVNLNDGKASDDSTLIQMFGTEDLNDEKKRIPSLLNSKPILRIGQKAAQVLKDKSGTLKKLSDYPYISEKLEIILSLCSLRGIPIEIGFEADKQNGEHLGAHRMKVHKLYAHFGICDNPPDHILPLDPSSNDHLDNLINCAVASGAFPFGLSSVQVQQPKEGKKKEGIIPAPDSNYLEAQIRRLFYANQEEGNGNVRMVPGVGHFETTVVDGGTINNEPFGEVLKILERHSEEDRLALEAALPEGSTNSNQTPDYYALLMIDPFPNDNKPEAPFEATESIEQMLFPLFGAVRGQAMVKEKEITAGFKLKHTRGLIKPQDGDKEYPIASGSLGGFGGFFKKEFREHDFFLGRKNCQAFLRKYFFIEQDIIENDPANLFESYKKCLNSLQGKEDSVYQKMYDQFAYVEHSEEGYGYEKVRYPIIPDMKIKKASSRISEENGKKDTEIPGDLLQPQIEIEALNKLKKPLRRRIRTLFIKLLFKLISKKKKDEEIVLDHHRREKLMAEKVILPDSKSGCLYVYDQKRYDEEVAEQRKEEKALETTVDKIIKRNFKAPAIFHFPLFVLARLVLALGLILVMWPLINIIKEKVFRAIVTDFKKRGLLKS